MSVIDIIKAEFGARRNLYLQFFLFLLLLVLFVIILLSILAGNWSDP